MGRRYANRTDRNHIEIMRLAEKMGLKVFDTSALGRGFPDLVVSYGWQVQLWEVKDGTKSPSKRRTTIAQDRLIERGWPVRIVTCAEDVLKAAKAIRGR